jgi:hypothetical protein
MEQEKDSKAVGDSDCADQWRVLVGFRRRCDLTMLALFGGATDCSTAISISAWDQCATLRPSGRPSCSHSA